MQPSNRGALPAILDPQDVDALGRQHLQLMTEVWILRDRIKLLESVLETAGLLKPEQLDQLVPDDTLRATLQQDRDAFVARIMGIDARDRTVERLKRHGI
jgi:hypothetical protein